jgi:thiol-disulfide isomerase/thioredoxin
MQKLFIAAVVFSFISFLSVKADVDLSKPLDLKFTSVDGQAVDFSKLRGKVVLVDFWATWCPPCVAISPDIVGLYKKYHSQGLDIVGISMDTDKKAMLDFIKKEGAPWPQYFENSDQDNVIAVKYGINSLPTLWLIDKKGLVVDPNFQDNWVTGFGIPRETPPETFKKLDAAIEKQLQAH